MSDIKNKLLIPSIFMKLLKVFLYFPLVILIVIAILVGTPFGARISLFLANTFVPNLNLVYSSGSLNKNINLSSATWSMSGVQVDLKNLQLKWQPSCLINKQLCVSNLFASSVAVDVDTTKFNGNKESNHKKTKTQPDYTVRLPFRIFLDNADLNQINVNVNDMQFNAEHIDTAANWTISGINVKKLNSQGLLVSIPQSTDETAKTTNTSPKNQNKSKATTQSTTTKDWVLANLPRVHNPVPVSVEQLHLNNSTLKLGGRTDNFSVISLSGSYLNTDIKLEKLAVQNPLGNIRISGKIRLDKHYPMQLDISSQLNRIPDYPELKPQRINIKTKGDFSDLRIIGNGEGDTNFKLDTQVNLADPLVPYNINLASEYLRWPFDKPAYIANDINLKSKGNLNEQFVELSTRIKTPFYPKAQVVTAFTHKNTELKLDYLSLQQLATSAYLQGEISFFGKQQPQNKFNTNPKLNIIWQGIVKTKNFDLTDLSLPINTALPKGKISASIKTDGSWSNKQWHVSATDMDISGNLKGYPLLVKGDFNIDSKLHLYTPYLQANVLGIDLNTFGRVDSHWNLDTKLSIAQLNTLMPELNGTLIAHINVTGKQNDPKLSISSSIENLTYDALAIKLIQLNGNYQLKNQNKLNVSLLNHGINIGKLHLDKANLTAKGSLKEQRIEIDSSGDVSVNAKIANLIDVENQIVNTKIDQLDIKSILGLWQLEKPISSQWNNSSQTAQVNNFCLIKNQNRLCLQNNIYFKKTLKPSTSAKPLKIQIAFDGEPSQVLSHFLPANIDWRGKTNLIANINWLQGQKPSADISMNMLPGSVTINRQKEMPAIIHYRGGNVFGSLNQDKLALNMDIDANELAKIKADLNVKVNKEKNLAGKITIEHININGFKAFLPQVANLKGKVSADLQLNGTLKKPQLNGRLLLKDGEFAASSNPTLLNKINARVTLMGQSADIIASWKMGKGQANLNGLFSWQSSTPHGSIQLKGKDLAVIAPPLAILEVSPNIKMQLSPQGANISGSIDIPNGDIKIVQLAEGGVPVSNDVVFKDSISESMEKIKPYPVTADINIKVADRVSIEGMGLNGKLAGTLNLQQQALRPPMLFGEIKVLNGSYKFLGQRLTIPTGELQFVGPAELPNLNIEAIRVIKDEDVTAGIKVTGTPKRPVVTLFSNPAKEQAEILSYIIKGSGFNNKDQNDSLMLSAALSLSTQLGTGAIGNIGSTATNLVEKIGISNVQLDTNDDGKVAISGYLGDRLMVKYGIGVFNPGYELTVRYYLLSRLYLETVSGSIDQSLDIYYSFDF